MINSYLPNDKLDQYILEKTIRENESLARLRRITSKDSGAFMQIPPEQGQFLAFLVKLIGAKKTIDLGTYTGYSSLAVALAMPDDSQTITCDLQPYWIKIAMKY